MEEKIKEFCTKERIIWFIIFATGILVRVVAIGKYPVGLNQDEASAGYDAYSVLFYGIDRNGISYPVHFIAWGSGQNAAYSYLCWPFIAVFGLSAFSIRVPMALIGCVSLYAVYRISRYIVSERYSYIVTAFFAICPWHIMKSRWALESNVFPDLILVCVWMLVEYFQTKKKRYLFFAAFILGVSSYAYGTAYCFIPLFAIPVAIYMLYRKQGKMLDLVISFFIALITALPMIIFVIINTFDMDAVNIGLITIPKLYVSRHMEITSVFSKEFFEITKENFKVTMSILLDQEDGLCWNSIKYYGIDYVISIPFTITGICICYGRKFKDVIRCRQAVFLLNTWSIASIVVALIVNPNINRINIVMIPLTIYSGIGLAYIIDKAFNIRKIFIIMYSVLFIMFVVNYFGKYQEEISPAFFESLSDAIEYADELETDKVYVSELINMPYIFTLFYTKGNPNEYIDSVQYINRYSAFEQVESYGKYQFDIPYDINEEENAAYIVENTRLNEFDLSYYDIKTFKRYSVIYK